MTILDCLFQQNEADQGGGIYHAGGSGTIATLRLRESRFENNSALGVSLVGDGGGLKLDPQPDGRLVEIVDCQFIDNTADDNGGGFQCESNCFLTNCTFNGNEASNGNGSALNLRSTSTNPTTLTVVNSLFYENTLPLGSGTVASSNSVTSNSSLELFNNTIADNTATSATASAGVQSDGVALLMRSNIVWGNAANGVSLSLSSQIQSTSGTDDVDYNLIQDAAVGGTVPFNGGSVVNNIDTAPDFVAPVAGDYQLRPSSPAIDAGATMQVPDDEGDVDGDSDDSEITPLDLALRSRFVDGSTVPGNLNNCNADVDIGALEFRFDCGVCATPGDVNGDGVLDASDIQSFVECLVDNTGGDDCGCQCGDYRDNNGVGLEDVPSFIRCLVYGPASCPALQECASGSGASDCNSNGINDDVDILTCDEILTPELCDCNKNGIPDGCDITATTSADVNSNNIPDECEPDCNGNNIPDSKDIADATSADCDSNGVPDECDQDCDDDGTPDACETLIDCNSNGIFDACEPDCDNDNVPDACELSGNDCNANLIPDDCEINAPPPFNLPDCNNNGVPDACDIDSSTSEDCNDNNIPDECDISTGLSEDCNSNGVPDDCDIASSTSSDTNSNGIPDECESQQQSQSGGGGGSSMMLGGGGPSSGMSGGSSMAPSAPAATWATFHDWCASTDFTGMSAGEVFEAIIDKQLELGLPPGQMFP